MLRLVPVKHEEILLHKIGHQEKMGGPFSETLFLRLGLPLFFSEGVKKEFGTCGSIFSVMEIRVDTLARMTSCMMRWLMQRSQRHFSTGRWKFERAHKDHKYEVDKKTPHNTPVPRRSDSSLFLFFFFFANVFNDRSLI